METSDVRKRLTQTIERTVLFADLRGSTALYETLGNTEATAVVTQSVALIARVVENCGGAVVKTLGDGLMAMFANLYRNWQINRVFHKARRVLADLFRFYADHPDSLPPLHSARAEGAGLFRAVSDYIAGMTDRFAMDEHRKLFGA